MKGEKLRKRLATITQAELADFCQRRYELLTTGAASLCNPGILETAVYAPFSDSDYIYGTLVGSLQAEPWSTICKLPPTRLIHPNPFVLSEYRPSKLTDDPMTSKYAWRCWDTAIGIPATAARGNKILPLHSIPAMRNTNDYWHKTAEPAMLRTGPIGIDGRIMRPTGPWLFDLTRSKDGWKIMEAAHVLAHFRGDDKPVARKYADMLGRTAGRLIQAVTEIVVCLAYDLPIDVGRKDSGKIGNPDLYYNTELKSSSEFTSPVVRLPWKNREAPRFDTTLAVMLTSVFIEPHPYGFDTHTGIYTLHDRWACLPSIVAIAGWETIDFITHQPLGTLIGVPGAPVDYAVRVEDLLPPETYWYYLALAQRTSRGDDKPLFISPEEATTRKSDDYNWQYFHDWIESAEYAALLAQTPPFPCPTCTMFNKRVPGIPEKPKGPRPTPKKGGKASLPKAWRQWDSDIAEINAIREKAIATHEVMAYGSREANRLRRQRKAGYKRKMALLNDQRLLEEGLRKRAQGGVLHGRQRELVREYRLKLANEGKQL